MNFDPSPNNRTRNNQLETQENDERDTFPGDTVWIKLSEGSWWPAVVVEKSRVNKIKTLSPSKSEGNVLVRLYGSSEFTYVDQGQWLSDFEVLRKNNANYLEVFRNDMVEHILSKISCRPKRQRSKEEKAATSKSKKTSGGLQVDENGQHVSRKSTKENGAKRKNVPNVKEERKRKSATSPKTQPMNNGGNNTKKQKEGVEILEFRSPKKNDEPDSQIIELSSRRMKVLQILGLCAPLGSPFSLTRKT